MCLLQAKLAAWHALPAWPLCRLHLCTHHGSSTPVLQLACKLILCDIAGCTLQMGFTDAAGWSIAVVRAAQDCLRGLLAFHPFVRASEPASEAALHNGGTSPPREPSLLRRRWLQALNHLRACPKGRPGPVWLGALLPGVSQPEPACVLVAVWAWSRSLPGSAWQ